MSNKWCSKCEKSLPLPRFNKNQRYCKSCASDWKTMSSYGITKKDLEELVEKQGGKCAICGYAEWGGKHNSPSIDHCHESGKVRGALCTNCNLGLGMFRDNPDTIKLAFAYLNDHQTIQKGK